MISRSLEQFATNVLWLSDVSGQKLENDLFKEIDFQ